MNLELIRSRRDQLRDEHRRLHKEAGNGPLSPAQQKRWDEVSAELDPLEQEYDKAVEADIRRSRVESSRAKWNSVSVGAGGGARGALGTSGLGEQEALDVARSVVDGLHGRELIQDGGAESASRLLAAPDIEDRTRAAAWLAAAGSESYLRAFAKVASDPVRGHLMWEPDEQAAYREVTKVQGLLESRAALGTGGYVLPVSLDPAIMLTSAGAINPLRQVARVVTTTTNSWRGITSGGATAEWKVEGAQAADGTPTVGEAEIETHAATCDVVFSYELEQDAFDLVRQLHDVILDAVDVHQLAAFTTGSGVGQPQGIITGLDGTSSEVSASASETLSVADVYALQNALPARFSGGASWLSNIAIRNQIARFETANGAHEFPELRQSPQTLLGKPWRELSQMDGTINAAATSDNFVLLYGDIAKAFIIVDRIGATMEFLPGFGANGRPTGQRHAFLFSRVGSEVVVPNAARLLNVATTA